MKYFIIAGERSGDLHGSYLIKAIRQRDRAASIVGYGGDLMQEQGMEVLSHYREADFMGFFEVLVNLRTALARLSRCKSQIVNFQPDAVILIDYPGFNLRMADFAKKKGFRTFYYISPKLWAWNKGRIKKIRRSVDRMLVIFPFEVAFYKKLNFPVTYVGNPLIEQIQKHPAIEISAAGVVSDHKIAYLPGSRLQEVCAAIPKIVNLARLKPHWQILVSAVDNLPSELFDPLTSFGNILIVKNHSYKILASAEVAVVTSGTATLEAALLGVPQVVCYETHPVSYAIGKHLVNIPYISLVNLIADEEIVKELLQKEYTFDNILSEIERLISDRKYREKMMKNYKRIENILGNKKASEEASAIIYQDLIS